MTRINFRLFVVTLVFICIPNTGFGAHNTLAQQPMTYNGPDHMPGRIIIKFRPGVNESVIAQINQKSNAKIAHKSRFGNFRVLTFPESVPPQEMVNIYADNPNVEYAELDHIAHVDMTPNDPYFAYQWHLDNSAFGGIGMKEAWELSTGSGVTVAVIDTGVKLGGPDGVPASGGFDFINNDSDPTDDNGHGTHVAGTIAQSTNNRVGVAGVAYGCSILPVKVLDRSGLGSYSVVAEGIYFAANAGAQVINMSLSGALPSITLENAVAYAYSKGVTIVCSSGNQSGSTPSPVGYPAAYNAYCIAVGATTYQETVAWYSNCGPALDLTAPGGDTSVDLNGDGMVDGVLQEMYSFKTKPLGWGYWLSQGTSMAAPHVSGVAALVISNRLRSTGELPTPNEVRTILLSTAEDKGDPGWDPTYGWGIVDAYRALGGGEPPIPILTSISVTPQEARILTCCTYDETTQQYTATGTYSDNTTKDITTIVTWKSSDTQIAAITDSGLVTSLRPGTTLISATFGGGIQGTATLTVTEPIPTPSFIFINPETASIEIDDTQQYKATAWYYDGSTLDITSEVAWTSSDISIATITDSGLAKGVGAGTVNITAAFDGVQGAASLTVTSPPVTLSSIAVTPSNASVVIGGTQQYTATGTYSDSTTKDLTLEVTWASSNAPVATISGSGLATGVNAGTALITATLLGIGSNTVSLTVTAPPPSGTLSATLSPMTFTHRKSGTSYLVTASVRVHVVDQNGQDVEGVTVTGQWSGAVRNVASGTTSGDGFVTFESKEVKTKKPLVFTLTLKKVEKSGYTFDGIYSSVTGTWNLP